MRLLEVGCAAKTPLSFLRGVFGFIEQLNGGGQGGWKPCVELTIFFGQLTLCFSNLIQAESQNRFRNEF